MAILLGTISAAAALLFALITLGILSIQVKILQLNADDSLGPSGDVILRLTCLFLAVIYAALASVLFEITLKELFGGTNDVSCPYYSGYFIDRPRRTNTSARNVFREYIRRHNHLHVSSRPAKIDAFVGELTSCYQRYACASNNTTYKNI